MTPSPEVQRFWNAFCASGAAPEGARLLEAFQIGDTPESADVGAALVLSGAKTATSQLSSAGAAAPSPGDFSVLLDGAGRPVAAVETVAVAERSLDAMDEAFARAYGEWDRRLSTLRRELTAHYGVEAKRLGVPFDAATPLLCEWFAVRWAGPTEDAP